MEVSLVVLMQNRLHVQLSVHLGTVWLCSPVFDCMAKILLCSTTASQECGHTIFRAQKSPSEVTALCGVKRQLGDLPGSLCWFSSRQDKQCAVDFGNGSSQAREMCSCVVRWPPWQDTVIGWFSLWSDPAQWSRVHWFQSWGWNCRCGRTVKYWSMQRLMVRLGATLFLEIFTFPASIGSPPKPIQNSQIHSHLFESGPATYLAMSAIPSHCSCCSSLWKSIFSLLKNTSKNGGKSTKVLLDGELLEVELDIASSYLFLVTNVNLCRFWWKQLFHECPVERRKSWLGIFNPELHG